MKKQKCVVWLLALMLVLGLLLPVCQGMATNPLFGAPKYFIPPKISNPPTDPPKFIIPPRDIFIPPQVTNPPEDDLTLTVDKTEATIGDILTFTAVWNNPPRGTSVFLWIFRDDECIQELPENADNRWEYKVESPGIYKGVAVGRFPILDDDLIKEDLHKESPLINVMETISVSTEEQYVMKGGSSVSDYEIELIGLRDIIFLEGGPAPPPLNLSFRKVDKKDPYVDVTYFYDRSAMTPGFELVLGEGPVHTGSKIVCKTTSADYKWPDGWFEKTYTCPVSVTCYHGVFGHSDYKTFKITVLRDSNKNGIPDFFEQYKLKGELEIQGISDVNLTDGQPFGGVEVLALHKSGKQDGKVAYEAWLPTGMKQTELRDKESGNYLLFISGQPLIDWRPEELMRKVPVSVRAFDEQDNEDFLTFYLNVYRYDGDITKQLHIVPVPKRTVIEGQEMVTTPITVLTNMKSDITLDMEATYFYIDDDDNLYVKTLGMSELAGRISPYYGPGSGWRETETPGVFAVTKWQLHGPVSYLNSKNETGPNPFYWGDDMAAKKTTWYYLVARSEDCEARQRVDIEVLRSTEDPVFLGLYPVEDKVVMDNHEMKVIQLQRTDSNCSWELYQLQLKTQLPNGVHFNPKTGQIFGKPKLTDWQMFEKERKFVVEIRARYDDVLSGVGFCLTVRRNLKNQGTVALTPVDDQKMTEGKTIYPIHISQVLPSPHRVTHINVDGLPDGLQVKRYGGYCLISGAPAQKFNWAEGETSRIYECKVSCVYPNSNGTVCLDQAPFTFNIELLKRLIIQTNLPMMLTGFKPPTLAIEPIADRRLPEGVEMEEIEFIFTDDSESGIDVTVSGLPSGVKHDLKSAIYGTPLLEDWDNAEVERPYTVLVEVVNDLGHQASTEFTLIVERAPVPVTPPESGADDSSSPDDTEKTPPLPDGTKTNIPEGYEIPWRTGIGETEPKPLKPIGEGGIPRVAVAQWGGNEEDFLQGLTAELERLGYAHGKNIELKLYKADGIEQTARENLQKIEQDGCVMVLSIGDSMSSLAKEHLQGRLPLIFAGVADPLNLQLVNKKSFGIGPVTGVMTPDLQQALLAGINQIQPDAHMAGLLSQANDGASETIIQLAPYAGLRLISMPDIAEGEEAFKKEMADTDILLLMYEPDGEQLETLVRLAAESGKALYARTASQVQQGAFMACLADMTALGRRSADLAAQLLDGADIQSLPAVVSAGTTLVYNMEPLSALSLTVPFDAQRVDK